MTFIPAARTGAVFPSDVLEMIRRARALEAQGREVAFLVQGEPDFDTPRHIQEASFQAVRDGYTHYPPAEGYIELRRAIAEKLERDNGVRYDPGQEVLVTNGAALGLYLAVLAIVEPGDEVILPDPAFGAYGMIVGSAGGVVRRVGLRLDGDRRRLDLEELSSAAGPRTKALLLCTPDNPSGHVMSEAELRAVGELALEHDFLIITDEVYEHFVYGDRPHLSLAALDPHYRRRTVLVNSFSKTYAMTGWRLGYNAAPAPIMAAMTKMNAVAGRAAAAFTQQAGIAALTGPQDQVAAMAAEYGLRRARMLELLGAIPDLGYNVPEGAFYVLVDCRAWGLPSRELAQALLEKGGVVVTPGDYYGPAGAGCLRLSFASSRETIERGMAGLAAGLAELREGRR